MARLPQVVREFSLHAIRAAFYAVLTLSIASSAANKSAGRELPEPDLPWSPVAASARADILGMLARQMQGNYERIRTWTGMYSIEQELPVSQAFVAKLPRTAAVHPEPLVQNVTFRMYFTIDMASGEIFRSKQDSTLRWLREGTHETVTIPNATTTDERSVVTAEHYLHFNAKNLQQGLRVLPDNPDAQMKRVGYRDPLQEAERRDLGDLTDPRLFYNSGSKRKCWDWLSSLSETSMQYGDALNVYAALAKGGTWYRFSLKMQGARGQPPLYSIATFTPEAGFNPVSLVLSNTESGHKPRQVARWRWKQFDGVYIPAELEQSDFNSTTDNPTYHRKAVLKECALNKPLDPKQFTYQALGMKNGDVVMDNIDRVVLTVKNAVPEKLANFGDRYFPLGAGPSNLSTGWRLAVVTGLLIVLTAILIVRRFRLLPAS